MKSEEYKAYKEGIKKYLTKERKNVDYLGIAQDDLRPLIGIFPTFFRYRTICNHVLSEIENQNIYLSSPSKFDDIFDSKCFVDKDSKSRGIANFYLTSLELSNNNDELFGLPEISRKYTKELDHVFNKINSRIDDLLRIACFTQNNTNIPMWYYYSNNHTGICIEYNLSQMDDYRKLGYTFLPVVYPNISDTNDYYELSIDDNNFNVIALRNSLVKSNDWKFEKEWRIVKFADNKDEIMFLDIPMKAIYFGYDCSDEDVRSVIQIISKNSLNIKLYKMQKTHMGLKPIKL